MISISASTTLFIFSAIIFACATARGLDLVPIFMIIFVHLSFTLLY